MVSHIIFLPVVLGLVVVPFGPMYRKRVIVKNENLFVL